jgi:hypothetical protein
MIRKTMDDVVVHSSGGTTPNVHSASDKIRYQKPAGSFSESAPQGREWIENNPFFEKVRPVAKIIPERKTPRRTFIWVIATFALVGTAFLVANYFSSATIEITPVTYQGHLDTDFAAIKEGGASAVDAGTMMFHFISLTDEKTKEVPATTVQKVEKKASGQVVIFNAYSKDSQRLIKNTRLESVDHKIYRIDQSVVVPGVKIVAGKSVPGSVEALVYADAPGAEYNIGAGDFTIPGFKGDPRFTKFTAHSKPDSPISGGFTGTVNVPTDVDVKNAQDELKLALKPAAIEKARALIPADMTFFPGSIVLKFEEVPQEYSQSDTSKVSVKATVSVFFFDTALLTQKIASSALTDYQGNPVTVSNMLGLSFAFVDPVDNVVLADIPQVRFHILGDPVFVGKIDEQKIKLSLAGKAKKDFAKIIIGEQNIGKADATVRPMWKSDFPQELSKIAIKILATEQK